MRAGIGVAVLVVSAGVAFWGVLDLHRRVPAQLADLLFAGAGAGLGAGALLFQHDVRPGEWIVTILLLAALIPVHARLLLRGAGPFRT